MELREMITFLEVARQRSFSRAAKNLGYSQAAVTIQIKQLEAELGVYLFDRIGKQTTMTHQGVIFYEYAAGIVRDLEMARQAVAQTGELTGELCVGTVESICAAIFPELLQTYHRLHPKVNIRVILDTPENLLKRMDQNTLDFVYLLDKRVCSGTWVKALEEAELILIVLDASRPQDDEDRRLLDLTEGRNRIVVINKKDLAPQAEDRSGTISICAAQNQIEPLIDQINQRYEHHHAMLELPSLANERQIALARQARQSMAQAVNALQDGAELDLVTIDLQAAYMALKEIVGEASREDLLDALFSKFCLGK